MAPWGLLALLGGIAYGYFSPGRTDKSRLFGRALLWGVVVGVVLLVLGWVFNLNPLGIGNDPIGLLLAFVVVLALFVLGVWLGDWIEGRRRPAVGRRGVPP